MNATNYWPVSPELARETEAHYRDQIVAKLHGKTPLEKVRLVTFDGVAPRITAQDVGTFLSFVDKRILGGALRGVGVEVGAGAGFFSALLAAFGQVEKVYAVEISSPIVEELMPEIVTAFSEGNEGKVVPCVGDFSHLELPDESVDFIFDFFSLHHSGDLFATFKEMARVLKPGGIIICLDKARADALSDAELDALLDKEYSAEGKALMGIDPKLRWTRRMNGEREFRLRDWMRFAEAAGLKLSFFSHVARTQSPNSAYRFIKEVLARLPVLLEMRMVRLLGFTGKRHPNGLETKEVIFVPSLNAFPKEISVFAFKK